MTASRSPLALLLLAVLGTPPAAAVTPSVVETEHATLRLVAEAPDAEGHLRGAVFIDLEPGWKTYWLDPGEAGLPPQLDFSGPIGEPALSFPVPHRFSDGFSTSIGYDAPMAIAFEAATDGGSLNEPLGLSIALGVCETVCIPVSARLELDLADLPEAGSDPLVGWAFSSLPEETSRITAGLASRSDRLDVRAKLPAGSGSKVDVFVAGPAGWSFGVPEPISSDAGTAVFEVPILARPKAGAAAGLAIDVLATSGEAAVFSRATPVDIH